jgi:hypothetical protein
MTQLCPTLSNLLLLGFERRPSEFGMATVGYRFPFLDLTASHGVNMYQHEVVLLGGVLNTGRTLAQIESQLPVDLETPEAASAWVSYALKSHRNNLEPLPDWMVEGERNYDLLPWIREQRKFEQRPRCYVDRDYARVFRRNLHRAIADLTDENVMQIYFDGCVLTLRLNGRTYQVVAEGDAWPHPFEVVASPEMNLPSRFMRPSVEVSYYDGSLVFGGYRYTAVEVVA